MVELAHRDARLVGDPVGVDALGVELACDRWQADQGVVLQVVRDDGPVDDLLDKRSVGSHGLVGPPTHLSTEANEILARDLAGRLGVLPDPPSRQQFGRVRRRPREAGVLGGGQEVVQEGTGPPMPRATPPPVARCRN